jgi:hypothetical protein
MPRLDDNVSRQTFGGLVGSCAAYCPVCRSQIAWLYLEEIELSPCVHVLAVWHDDFSQWGNRRHWKNVEDLDDETSANLPDEVEWVAVSEESRAIDAGNWVELCCQWDTSPSVLSGGSWNCKVAWAVVGATDGLVGEIEAQIAKIKDSDPYVPDEDENEDEWAEE